MGRGMVVSRSALDFFQGGVVLTVDTDDDGNPDVFDTDNDGDGLEDETELAVHQTDPNDTDSDGDEMPDGWEVENGLAPTVALDANGDADGDGFSNLQEYLRGDTPTEYALTIDPGWNLLSIARVPDDNSTAAVFGANVMTPVWRWDAERICYIYAHDVLPLCGHWAYCTADASTEVVIDQQSITGVDTDGDGFSDAQEVELNTDPAVCLLVLKAGWNLVSLARLPDDHSVYGLFGRYIRGPAWIWNGTVYEQADELLPLRGHWVFAHEYIEIELGE